MQNCNIYSSKSIFAPKFRTAHLDFETSVEMKILMISKVLRLSFLLALISFSIPISAQIDAEKGKTIFRNACATCHSRDMRTASTGPALGGFQENWAAYPREDLYGWVRNSQAMIKAGQPRAVELWDEYGPTVMNANPNLTDEDIESVFAYIDEQYNKVDAGPVAAVGGEETGSGTNYNWLYYALFALLAVLAMVLAGIIRSLDTIIVKSEGGTLVQKSLFQRIFTKRVISFIIFGVVVFGGMTTVTNAINLGRQQGYVPDQPINFSHEIHAGEHQIDCNYCHDGARRSKHATIPDANTCMNCHMAIKNGSNFGTAELTKIYASVGYDPLTNQYIEDYPSLSTDEIKAIYEKWIADQYMESEGLSEMDSKGNKLVKDQWEGIVSSLTNEEKENIQGPIEWVRVHNLPDHVYFNHSQHVVVGEVECQSCHGKVEEMGVAEQFAPLSMGWCINCHRQTEVNFEGNEYYANYELYHEQLSSGMKDKVTVQDIGGLECQKCHY